MEQRTQQTTEKLQQAMALVKAGDAAAGAAILQELYRSDQNDGEISGMLGAANIQLKKLADAAACFTRMLELSPENPMAYFYLGEVRIQQGEPAKAIEHYLHVLRLSPRDPQFGPIFFRIAVVLQQQSQFDHAVECYKKSLQLQPDSAVAYYNLAFIHHSRKEMEQAKTCLEQAIGIKPDYVAALNNLASLHMELGKTGKAEGFYRRAHQLQPASTEIALNLGQVLHRRRKFAESVPFFEQIVARDANNFPAWKALGAAYAETRDKEKSIACYRRALEIDPDSVTVKYRLAVAGDGAAQLPERAPDEYVSSLFDGYADNFDQHLVESLNYQTPEELYKSLAGLLDPANKRLQVLDLGCGTGLCGKLFADYARHLTGVDLSAKMIDKARELGCFDDLIVGNVLDPLQQAGALYDLVLSADVFVYIGELGEIFAACKKALSKGGLFGFSVEAGAAGITYVLQDSGRYAHSAEYIRKLADSVNLKEVSFQKSMLRMENGQPVNGYIVVLRNDS